MGSSTFVLARKKLAGKYHWIIHQNYESIAWLSPSIFYTEMHALVFYITQSQFFWRIHNMTRRKFTRMNIKIHEIWRNFAELMIFWHPSDLLHQCIQRPYFELRASIFAQEESSILSITIKYYLRKVNFGNMHLDTVKQLIWASIKNRNLHWKWINVFTWLKLIVY